jgi:hypothetical protein
VALFNAGVSVLNQTIWNGSKILINVSSSLMNAIPQAISNYTKCVSSSKSIFSFFIAIPSCGVAAVTKQFAAFANTTNAQIRSAQKIFNQLLSPSSTNSTVHTIPQMANLAAQIMTSAGGELAAVSAQTMLCIEQALNSTFG